MLPPWVSPPSVSPSPSVKRLARAERVYRALLRLYPEDYRREYAAPMAQLFRDLYRDAYHQHSCARLVRLWQRVLADTVVTAAIEHILTLEKGVYTMNKQHQYLILFLSGLPLGLGLMLLLINPKFMLQLLAPNAAQPVGWLMTIAVVGLADAAYVVQRKILRSTPIDTSAGVVQSIPLRSRLYLVGTIAFLVFPAILLVLLGPAFITLMLAGAFH
jgi:hypothetical protein